MSNANIDLIKQGLIGIAAGIKAGIVAKIVAVKTKVASLFVSEEAKIHAALDARIAILEAKLGIVAAPAAETPVTPGN